MTEQAHITVGLESMTQRRNLMQMIAARETGRDASVVRGAHVAMRALEQQMMGEQTALEFARGK